MSKFIIEASEQVYYRYEVEAENQEEAREKALDYLVTHNDIEGGEHFSITTIKEKENANV